MQQLRIELSEDQRWQYKAYGANGENLVTSETYTRKHDAERGFDDLARAVLKILSEQGRLGQFLEEMDGFGDDVTEELI